MWDAICDFFSWIFNWLSDEDTVDTIKHATTAYANVINMVNSEMGFQ